MPTRTPPSPEQVIEILRREVSDMDERVLPWVDAERVLRRALRTVKVNSSEWLRAACLASDDLWLTYVYSGGAMHGALTHNDGKHKKIKAPFVVDALGAQGFTGSPGWTYVDEFGGYAEPDRREDLPESKNGRPFVGTRKGIQYLLDQETRTWEHRRVQRQAEEIVAGAAFEHEHGNAADYVRGLLSAAGIAERKPQNEVSTFAADDADRRKARGLAYTSLEMRIVGSDIDRLVALLQRLGIQPIAEGER